MGNDEQERDSEPLLHLAGAHVGQLLGFLPLLPIWEGRKGEGDSAQGGQDSRNLPILLVSKRILFSSLFLLSIFSSPSRQGCTEISGSVLKRQHTYRLGAVSLISLDYSCFSALARSVAGTCQAAPGNVRGCG